MDIKDLQHCMRHNKSSRAPKAQGHSAPNLNEEALSRQSLSFSISVISRNVSPQSGNKCERQNRSSYSFETERRSNEHLGEPLDRNASCSSSLTSALQPLCSRWRVSFLFKRWWRCVALWASPRGQDKRALKGEGGRSTPNVDSSSLLACLPFLVNQCW